MPPIPLPTVIVEAGGTHQFKLDENGGAARRNIAKVCAVLLGKCGFDDKYAWRLRVEKTKHCDPKSRIVRVISPHPPYGVTIRIKADPNDTHDHSFTLLIPEGSGLDATELFNMLKANQKRVSRFWRNDYKAATRELVVISNEHTNGHMAAAVEEKPVENPLPEEKPDFTLLSGLFNDPVRLRYLMTKIRDLSAGVYTSLDDWRERLMNEIQTAVPSRIVQSMVSRLEDRGYVSRVENDRLQHVSYRLTAIGKRMAVGDERAMQDAADHYEQQTRKMRKQREMAAMGETSVVKEKNPDVVGTLVNFAEQAQLLADAGKKIQNIHMEEMDIKKQIEVLQDKLRALGEQKKNLSQQAVKSAEAYSLIKRLADMNSAPDGK